MAEYNIADLVKTAIEKSPLPARYDDLDEQNKRRLERQAEAEGTTPQRLYEVIKAQAAADAADGFDAQAIAKSVRRR